MLTESTCSSEFELFFTRSHKAINIILWLLKPITTIYVFTLTCVRIFSKKTELSFPDRIVVYLPGYAKLSKSYLL